MSPDYEAYFKQVVECRIIEKRTKQLEKLVSDFGSKSLISVECAPHSWCDRKRCFKNVEEQIRRLRGHMLTGWMFVEYRDKFIEGEAHGIWVSPTGKKLDITPHDLQPTRILFSEQPSVVHKRLYTFPKPKLFLTDDPRVRAVENFETAVEKLHSAAFDSFGKAIVTKTDDIIAAADEVGLPQDVAYHLIQLRVAQAARYEKKYGAN